MILLVASLASIRIMSNVSLVGMNVLDYGVFVSAVIMWLVFIIAYYKIHKGGGVNGKRMGR